jgi:hypothetical protein
MAQDLNQINHDQCPPCQCLLRLSGDGGSSYLQGPD